MTRDWRHAAACRDYDPEMWFPVGTSGPALLQLAEAKAVCRRCPVRDECLEWAIASGQDSGVWGGLSEDERRAANRSRRRTGQRFETPEPEPLRVCSTCRTDRPVSQFHKESKRQDGLSRQCKHCVSIRDAKRRERDQQIAS